jgi:hypothetical protein
MKRNMILLLILMLWASPAAAQQASSAQGLEAQTERLEEFDAKASLGYWEVNRSGSASAGKYDYFKSSVAGGLDLEWDPLPHRFVMETSVLNKKDYFGSADYSYRDVVVVNIYTRGLYHNLPHYSLGQDDPLTATPSFTDRIPGPNTLLRTLHKVPAVRPQISPHSMPMRRPWAGTIQQRFLLDQGAQTLPIPGNRWCRGQGGHQQPPGVS